MTRDEILALLQSLSDRKNVEGMASYGIVSKCEILGIPKPVLRDVARRIGVNQRLAMELWEACVHEARILACMIADPSSCSCELLDKWVEDIDNWDLCDQCVFNLFWRTRFAWEKAKKWSMRSEEFVRRAGFALMAKLAISDRRADDERFLEFFPMLLDGSMDERRYVYMAVAWALKKIGKRNKYLKKRVLFLLEDMRKTGVKSALAVAREVYVYLCGESGSDCYDL